MCSLERLIKEFLARNKNLPTPHKKTLLTVWLITFKIFAVGNGCPGTMDALVFQCGTACALFLNHYAWWIIYGPKISHTLFFYSKHKLIGGTDLLHTNGSVGSEKRFG